MWRVIEEVMSKVGNGEVDDAQVQYEMEDDLFMY